MRVWPLWLVLGGLAGSGGLALRQQQAELRALAQQVAQLRAQADAARAAEVRPVLQLLRESAATPPAVPKPAATPREVQEAKEVEPAAGPVPVQERFAGEVTDAAWAASAERSLSDRLGPLLGTEGRLGRVQCRGTLCRVETVHADGVALQRFVSQAFLEAAPEEGGPRWQEVQSEPPEALSDGRVLAVSYLLREAAP